MPLIEGKSKKAFVKNLKSELESGKPKKQALAIAYSIKRRNSKAHGGVVQNEKLHPEHSHVSENTSRIARLMKKKMAMGGMVESDDDMFLSMPDDNDELDSPDAPQIDEAKERIKRVMGKRK